MIKVLGVFVAALCITSFSAVDTTRCYVTDVITCDGKIIQNIRPVSIGGL